MAEQVSVLGRTWVGPRSDLGRGLAAAVPLAPEHRYFLIRAGVGRDVEEIVDGNTAQAEDIPVWFDRDRHEAPPSSADAG